MTERYIPGVPCWADAVYPDAPAAAEFYSGLFGWECEDTMPADHPGNYFQASLDGGQVAAVSSTQDGVAPDTSWNTYVWVDDADATTEKARQAGATVTLEPWDIPGSGRVAMFTDPQGASIGLWQPAEHRGATTVNQAGAIVFNDLYTTDLDGAAAFYKAVFGWDLSDLGGTTVWTMPAYGDHLETLFPGTRAQAEGMGVPGWENVVASAQTTEEAPHWSVTFAADDVDAVVASAKELGATVVSGPTTNSWTREAVIEDPQGVRFTASQFAPENG